MKCAWKQIAVAISYMAMGLSLAAIGARAQTKETAASAEDASKFIEAAEQQLFDLAVKGSRFVGGGKLYYRGYGTDRCQCQ